MKQQLAIYIAFYESLNPAQLGQIDELFSEQALFQDPFNRVRGPQAIKRIFAHLLHKQPDTRFMVTEQMLQQQTAYLRWQFWPNQHKPLCIEGVSRIQFDAQGKIIAHIDYWDSMSQLYARLPLIGPIARWLLKRVQANHEDQINRGDS